MRFEPLTELEMELYEVLQDYLKQNKQFTLKSALPICFNALDSKYTQKEITTAVNNLIRKKYIIQGSSLSRDDILRNNVRKQIYKFIQINPGAYNRLIRRELNLGSHEFNWHSAILEKFGYIKKVKFGRSFGYFENRSFMDHEYDLFLLQNEKVNQILDFLQNEPGTISQIASHIDQHYSTVKKYVEEMEKREIVKEKTDAVGKITVYTINAPILIKLRKIINGQVFVEFA